MTLLDCVWNPPPADLTLPHDEIHVWRVSLDQPVALVEQLTQTLSADERERAERYHFPHDKQRFIVGRGLLRQILGRYIGVEPGLLQFGSGPYGKPTLAETPGTYAPRFNVSHSQGLAIYAFTRDREIGVDLEYIRPIAEGQQIAERYFAVQESTLLRHLPPADMYREFFTYWTRMEASLKASGQGLSGLPIATPGGWFIQSLIPAPGYIAALAIPGGDIRIMCWQWSL